MSVELINDDIIKIFGGDGVDSITCTVSDGSDRVLIDGGADIDNVTVKSSSSDNFTVVDSKLNVIFEQGDGGTTITVKDPVHTYQRDGQMRTDGNAGGCPVYQPNSFAGPVDSAEYTEPALRISGDADRYDHRQDGDDYTQAGDLYRLMDVPAQQRLVSNIVSGMQTVPEEIQRRQVEHFIRADDSMSYR